MADAKIRKEAAMQERGGEIRVVTIPASIASIVAFFGITVFQPVAIQDLLKWQGQASVSEKSGNLAIAAEKGRPIASARSDCTRKALKTMSDDRGYPAFLNSMEDCLAKQEH